MVTQHNLHLLIFQKFRKYILLIKMVLLTKLKDICKDLSTLISAEDFEKIHNITETEDKSHHEEIQVI